MTDQTDIVILRDPKPLWPWLKGFLLLALFVSPVLALLSIAFLQISRGDPMYDPQDLVGVNLTLGLLGAALIWVVAFIACIIFTMRITYRMMKNAHALKSSYAEIGPAWAVWSYFVPFANLVFPVRAVGQIWRATFSELEGPPPKEPKGAIGWWWACWLIGNICDNAASRLTGEGFLQTPTTPGPNELVAAQVLTGAGAVFTVIGCILMIRLFGTLVRAQSQLVEKHG